MKWQPIESAPEDPNVNILVSRYDEDGSYWCSVAQWWVAAWVFLDGQTTGPVLLDFEPTHWMPLPAPPTGTASHM